MDYERSVKYRIPKAGYSAIKGHIRSFSKDCVVLAGIERIVMSDGSFVTIPSSNRRAAMMTVRYDGRLPSYICDVVKKYGLKNMPSFSVRSHC